MIARALVNRGHEVVYIAIDCESEDTDYQIVATREHELEEAIRRCSPDIIYWRYNKRHFLRVVKYTHSLGIPFVFACSAEGDLNPISSSLTRSAAVRFVAPKILYQRATSLRNYFGFVYVDHVVVQSKEQMMRSPISASLIRNSYLAQHADFSWPRPYVCWVGTVKPIKQPSYFLELASTLQADGVDFLMVGSNPLGFDFSDSPSNFHFLGPLTYPQANTVIAQSRVVVHTSMTEGFSNVLIQSWSQGVPTLTLELDPDNLISREGLGFVASNSNELASYLRRLLDDSELWQSTSERAKGFALREFDLSRNVSSLEACFERVLNNQDE